VALLLLPACGGSAEQGGCGGTGPTCPFAPGGYARVEGVATLAGGAPLVRGTKDAVFIRCGLPAVLFGYGESTDAAGRYAFDLAPLSAPPPGEAFSCELRGALPGFRPETVAVRFSRARADRPTTTVNLQQVAVPGA
jgi:hypothetical protein